MIATSEAAREYKDAASVRADPRDFLARERGHLRSVAAHLELVEWHLAAAERELQQTHRLGWWQRVLRIQGDAERLRAFIRREAARG